MRVVGHFVAGSGAEFVHLSLHLGLAVLQTLDGLDLGGFGRLPKPARYLITSTELRVRAALFGISAVEIRENKLMLTKKGGYLQINGRFPRLKGKNEVKRLENALELIKTL